MRRIVMSLIILIGIMASCCAQTVSQKIKNDFRELFTGICKDMNQQTPIQVDGNTTLLFMSFINWQLTYHYKLNCYYTDFSEYERKNILRAIKDNGIKGWRREIQTWDKSYTYSQYVNFLRRLGLKICYDYIDANNMPFGKTTITCQELQ